MIPVIDRLRKRLRVMPNGCWEWQGATTRGYGEIRVGSMTDGSRRMVKVHRVVWGAVFGPIPEGLHVLHSCDNPPCANPAHLFLGTNADNVADKVAKGRGAAGENHGRSKLTWGAVQAIHEDSRTHGVIASEYGVARQTIQAVKAGEIWKEKALC